MHLFFLSFILYFFVVADCMEGHCCEHVGKILGWTLLPFLHSLIFLWITKATFWPTILVYLEIDGGITAVVAVGFLAVVLFKYIKSRLFPDPYQQLYTNIDNDLLLHERLNSL